MIFQCNVYIKKVETTDDGGLILKVATQELPEEDEAKILKLRKHFCWMAIKTSDDGIITEEELDIPETTQEFKTDKTPSQRLRNVMYVFWSQNNSTKEDFETFYKRNMEKIINKIKEELS